MTDDFDFYDLLGIDENASQAEVKDSFRAKVREYHPDLNDDPDAPAQFSAVKKAYEILKDPTERQAYDRLGHEEYVAKRTSGIPDPSAWRTDDVDSGGDLSDGTASTTANGGSSTASSSAAESDGSRSSRSSSSSSRSSRASPGRSSRSDSSSNRRASTSGTTSKRSRTSAGSTSAGGGSSTDSTVGTVSGSPSSSWTDNALFNWWRSLQLGWPLMLTSTLLFVVGVGYWAAANLGAFRTFASAVNAAGTDTAALRSALVARHGVPTLYGFVQGTELVAPPVGRLQWYGALAGFVGATVLAFAAYRAVWAERPKKWVTMNETVGVGVAIAISGTLYGGPLLAGAVVLPFVFAVIVRHTRVAYKFKPTYGYVLGVTVPLAVVAAESVVANPPLAVDLVAVALPVLSMLVLLFSAFVRPKLFG